MNEGNKFTFKDIVTNKQYRAIFSLLLYFVMFLILVLIVRLGSSDTSTKTNNNKNNDMEISDVQGFDSIKSNNYNFIYTLDINDIKKIYSGKQRDLKTLFTVDNKTYYKKDEVYLMLENDQYILKPNPNEYFNFFDVTIIENIIKNSKVEDDTYSISLNKFLELIGNEKIETEDNITFILVKSNGIITKIEFDLTNYIKNIKQDVTKANLILEYKDFSLIDDFEIK